MPPAPLPVITLPQNTHQRLPEAVTTGKDLNETQQKKARQIAGLPGLSCAQRCYNSDASYEQHQAVMVISAEAGMGQQRAVAIVTTDGTVHRTDQSLRGVSRDIKAHLQQYGIA